MPLSLDEKPKEEPKEESDRDDGTGCSWGFDRFQNNTQFADSGGDLVNVVSSKFIPLYERYLDDKQGFIKETKNYENYINNPQKTLKSWFEFEAHEFEIATERPNENEYICSINIPIGEHDFTITSEPHNKKQNAVDEICISACKLLDESQLLYQWESAADGSKEDTDKKRRFAEASKEDDIELDSTSSATKRQALSTDKSSLCSKVNTYESLMAKWHELNRTILQLKAKSVKLDLSIAQHKQAKSTNSNEVNKQRSQGTDEAGDEDSIDPLDAFMSSLETSKSKLSMDEKIEKSRIKAEIAACEKKQANISRLIELAKPQFDLDKACPLKRPGNSSFN